MDPITWVFLALLIISTVLSLILRPEPPKQGPQDPGKLPTADPSRHLPVLFGKRTFRNPNTVWYGDLRADSVELESGKK